MQIRCILILSIFFFVVDARVPAYPRFERRHEPQGGYRPERPYSAGAQPIYTVSPERHYEPTYRKSYDGGYLSSPERRYDPARSFPPPPVSPYEEPYYGGTERIYGTRSGSVTPVVDEEARYIRVHTLATGTDFPQGKWGTRPQPQLK